MQAAGDGRREWRHRRRRRPSGPPPRRAATTAAPADPPSAIRGEIGPTGRPGGGRLDEDGLRGRRPGCHAPAASPGRSTRNRAITIAGGAGGRHDGGRVRGGGHQAPRPGVRRRSSSRILVNVLDPGVVRAGTACAAGAYRGETAVGAAAQAVLRRPLPVEDAYPLPGHRSGRRRGRRRSSPASVDAIGRLTRPVTDTRPGGRPSRSPPRPTSGSSRPVAFELLAGPVGPDRPCTATGRPAGRILLIDRPSRRPCAPPARVSGPARDTVAGRRPAAGRMGRPPARRRIRPARGSPRPQALRSRNASSRAGSTWMPTTSGGFTAARPSS
jgi:hypothetical protein